MTARPIRTHPLLRLLGVAALLVATLCAGLYGSLALWFRQPLGALPPAALPALWLAVMVAVLVAVGIGRRLAATAVLACALVAFGLWWTSLRPSNDRDWADDVARAVTATLVDQRLHLDAVRAFRWRSETDRDQRWEPRDYDLRDLVSADLITSHWMTGTVGEAIAHVMVSFGFTDGRRLIWSIELRRERSEAYSALAGFFKQAELVMIAGDETDLIGVRTALRGEDVRVYPLTLPTPALRALLVTYAREANRLARKPRWYNTLTTNCTTAVFSIARAISPGLPHDWRVVASGYLPDFAYDRGALDTSVPFSTLRARAGITERAKAADGLTGAAYSQAIRAGLAASP